MCISLKSIYYHVGPVVYLVPRVRGCRDWRVSYGLRLAILIVENLLLKHLYYQLILIGTITVYSKFSSNELLKSYIVS